MGPPSVTKIRLNALSAAIKTAFKHFLSRNYPAEWDLDTHIKFEVLRELLTHTGEWTVEDYQRITTRPLPPPKGMWAIPTTISVSDAEKEIVEREVRPCIAKLGPGVDDLEIKAVDVTGEWHGYKRVSDEKSANWSPKEQYSKLAEDTRDGPVIMYFHGGAYMVLSVDTHRPMTQRLTTASGGRAFSIKYRLAPQDPFPAALIDAVVAYRYLIDPPPDAFHKPVDPAKIILAGDSAGGGLAFALMVFLAHSAPALPLPGGVIGMSPWLDITHSFPSARVDRGLDYLPDLYGELVTPKASKLWPPEKPRYDFYTDLPLHPLVSPVLAADEILPKCPPILIVSGDNEYLRDESLYFARNFVKNGGKIRLQIYRAMPHVFQIFKNHPCAKTSFKEFNKFIKDVTSGKTIETDMRIVDGKGQFEESPLDFIDYDVAFTKEELLKRMETNVSRRRQRMAKVSKTSPA